MVKKARGHTASSPKYAKMLVNHNSTTLLALRDSEGRIDMPATIALATKAVEELSRRDEEYTKSIGRAAIEAWSDHFFSEVRHMALSALVRMALTRLNIVPTDANCKDGLIRLRSVIAANPGKFMMMTTKNNSNVYLLSRYKDGEIERIISGKK